jgi:hypothetical protein
VITPLLQPHTARQDMGPALEAGALQSLNAASAYRATDDTAPLRSRSRASCTAHITQHMCSRQTETKGHIRGGACHVWWQLTQQVTGLQKPVQPAFCRTQMLLCACATDDTASLHSRSRASCTAHTTQHTCSQRRRLCCACLLSRHSNHDPR